MPYINGRWRTKINRQPNPGKKPDSKLQELIEEAIKASPKLTPQEIKAVLAIKGIEATSDEIIWVKNQK